MPWKYILDGHLPVRCEDPIAWGRWFETAERHVADTLIGIVRISTVFLGLDHAFGRGVLPVLFETMVFGGHLDGQTHRYTSWTAAEAGHQAMVTAVYVAEGLAQVVPPLTLDDEPRKIPELDLKRRIVLEDE